jgi:hypothetical protein
MTLRRAGIGLLLVAMIASGIGGSFATGLLGGGHGGGQASQWGYFEPSGGGVWPNETTGGTDGAAVEFSGNTTTLWMASFDLSDDVDEILTWAFKLPHDYLNGGSLSAIEITWVTDDADLGTVEFEVRAKALGDGDSIGATAWSSAVSQSDTSNGANKINTVTFSSSLTPSNSPVRGDYVPMEFLIDESESTINTTAYLTIAGFKYPRAQ